MSELVVSDPADGAIEQAAPAADPFTSLLQRAVCDPAFDLARLEKLFSMKRDNDADLARRAFARDMVLLKAEGVKMPRTKRVRYQTQGGVVDYTYLPLDDMIAILVPLMAVHGFSHSWQPSIVAGSVRVVCKVRHIDGHVEETALESGFDAAGKMSPTQVVASTVKKLQRHTLLAAIGLSSVGEDIEGESDGTPVPTTGATESAWTAEYLAAASEIVAAATREKKPTLYRDWFVLQSPEFRAAVVAGPQHAKFKQEAGL